MGVGDALARWVFNEQPTKFAAIEMVPKTSSDVPEVLFGHLNSEGQGGGWHRRSPAWPRSCPTPGTGTSTVVQGLDKTPAEDRPTNNEVNVTHLAWDLMVGLGTLLFLLTLWCWASWIFRRDMPKSRWFLRAAAASGVLAVITMEAGWMVSEVGRQPWIVYEKMKVEDAATANTGIWITFIGVVILYVGLGVTTILVLRRMSRRFRDGEAGFDEADVPVRAERAGAAVRAARTSGRCRSDEHRGCRHPVRRDHDLRGLRRGRLRRRLLGPRRRGREARRTAPRGHRPRHRPVWEANHVWLIFVFVLLWTCFPEAYASITLTLFVPLTLAALGIVLRGRELRVPQGGVPHPGPAQLRCSLRSLVGPGALLLRCGGRRHRLGTGPGGWRGGRSVGQLGQPDLHRRRRARRVPRGLPGGVLPGLATPSGSRTRRWWPTSGAGDRGRRGGRGGGRRPASSCCPTTRTYLFDGLPRGPCRW